MLSLLATGSAMAAPLVIAHRGFPGRLPDHTLEGYAAAIDAGADYVEPDLVPTRDGHLVARHENELSMTTDVAERFPERRTVKTIDGKRVEGWFTEDFTLAELKTLHARQPLPFRPHDHDDRYRIPTLEEILELVAAREKALGRRIGVYPETKHPSWFDSIGLSLEEPLARILKAHGYDSPDDPVFLQSFEDGSLQELAGTGLRRIRLVDTDEPLDAARLAAIRGFADGVGVHKSAVIDDGGAVTPLVAAAHAAGLLVHVWTFRNEPEYLPTWAEGEPAAELRRFYAAGVDGVFSDFCDLALAVRAEASR